MATLKDVAALAQVHPSTVSRVLRSTENLPISDNTRRRIMDAVKELDYHPDQRARALRLGKSNTVGLIIPDISNSFFANIAKSIEEESYNAGYTLVVCVSNEDQEKEVHFVNNLTSRGIDGLVIAPVQDSYSHLVRLKKKKYPFVLIDRCFEEFETNAIISDNETSSFEAVEHLVNLGHKRIAFLSGRPTIYTIRKRLDGYLNAQPPTALLISGNRITFGALKAIVEKNLKIPDDISIIGFTDSIVTPYLISPLTTITHPLRDMGIRAFQLLLQHMNSRETLPFSRIVVQTKMVLGASTASVNGKLLHT